MRERKEERGKGEWGEGSGGRGTGRKSPSIRSSSKRDLLGLAGCSVNSPDLGLPEDLRIYLALSGVESSSYISNRKRGVERQKKN